MTTSMNVRQHLAIISATCQESRQTFDRLIKKAPSGSVLTAEKVEELTKHIFQEIKQYPSNATKIKNYNVNHSTIKNSFNDLKVNFYAIFTKENVFTKKQLYRKLKSMTVEWQKVAFAKLGVAYDSAFNSNDFIDLGLEYINRSFECFDYVVLKSKEKNLFDVIYSPNFAERKKKAMTLLKDLGYKGVEKPLAGDLVGYGDTKPMHWGLMTSETMVISKWGQGGYVWKHKLSNLPSFYGECLGFLRRPEKKK